MHLQNRIFKLIDEQKLLVFPNQISADSWADFYAESNPGKAVFTDKLVSWDKFLDSCRQIPQNAEKAETVHRLFFVSDYLKKEKLNTLCPDNFPQSKANFEDEIATSLPDLPRTLETENLDYALKADISRVLDAYRQYLKENNLYEKNYLAPDFSKAPQGTTLVFASVLSDSYENNFDTIEASDEDLTAKIKVFDSSLSEIRYTFAQIRKLLEQGCRGADIKITTASKEMYPWLEAEAQRAGIPISIVMGKRLSDFNAGRLFKAIKNVVSNRWSAESVRNLLLNPAFPIKGRADFEKLVSFAVEYKVVPSDGASSWLFKLEDQHLQLQFASLRDRIQALESAKSFDALRQAIHAFADDYLDLTQEEFNTAYTRCMETLESLVNTKAGNSAFSAFDMFLRLLSMTPYTPKTPSDAIAVYTYPSNAAMVAKHHFAIAFSDIDTVAQRKIPPYTDKEGLPITDALISSFLACGAQISCAIQSYSGEVSVPSFFEDRKHTEAVHGICTDSFSAEEQMWSTGSVSSDKALPGQKALFEKALETTLRERTGRVFKEVPLPMKITATSLGVFLSCPFRWYCNFVLGLEETDYQADMSDNMEVGRILHDTLETWLMDSDGFSKNKLEQIFEKRLSEYRHSKKAAYLPRQERIDIQYSNILYDIVKALPDFGFIPVDKELRFEKNFDGYYIKGFIDFIFKDRNGNYVVLDFKKKYDPKKPSMQVQFYALALDEKPVMGAYYSIEEGKLYTIWDSKEKLDLQLEELKNVLQTMKKTAETGVFEPTPSKDNCSGCEYRGVCRTRYVIK